VDKTPVMDAAMYYSLLFGSEKFEAMVGELKMVAQVMTNQLYLNI